MLDRVTLAPATGVAPVLSEASLTLAAGATLALVGPSGAGKSTLLAAIAGEIAPLSGRILVEGMEPHRREQRARAATALVAQGHDLVDALDAKRNAMAGALGRWSSVKALREFVLPSHAARTEARTALAAVGLGGMENRRTGSLSGGERQRVAIARALVQAPRLLLADEPVASLDPDNAARILELLTGLARERNMALLCTLHQPELATRYFDRVARLNAGRLEIGTA